MTRAFIFAAMIASPAASHDWYSRYCCDDRDCAPIPAQSVQITADGFAVTLAPGQHLTVTAPLRQVIGYTAPQVLQSQDSDFHACILPGQTRIRCLYVPHFGG